MGHSAAGRGSSRRQAQSQQQGLAAPGEGRGLGGSSPESQASTSMLPSLCALGPRVPDQRPECRMMATAREMASRPAAEPPRQTRGGRAVVGGFLSGFMLEMSDLPEPPPSGVTRMEE